MSDEPDTPKKVYGFKPTDFERSNPTANFEAASDQPIDVRELAREATRSGRLLDGTNSPANRENDVHAILRENLRHANAGGLNDIKFGSPRRSRRKRDYVLAMIVGNMVLAVCTIISPVFGGAGLVIYNVGFTWIVWGVMDDY